MRHQKAVNHLGRTSTHRNAMLANMACSLIKHKHISTTVAKAKALRSYIEPLITKAKSDSTHSRRIVFSYLQDKEAVTELFREISVKVADRPGGYTRILKTGFRLGDNADICVIELVDYNENLLAAKEETKKASRRRRSKSKKTETEAAPVAEKAPKAKTKAKEKVEEAAPAPAPEPEVEPVEDVAEEPATQEQEETPEEEK